MENQSTKLKKDKIDKFFPASGNYKKNQKIKKESIFLKKHIFKLCAGFVVLIIISTVIIMRENGESELVIENNSSMEELRNENYAKNIINEQNILEKEESENKVDLSLLGSSIINDDTDANAEYDEVNKKYNEIERKLADAKKDRDTTASTALKEDEVEAKKAKEQLATEKEAEDTEEKEAEDAKKKERQAKVSSITAKLSEAKSEIASEMNDISTEMESLRQKIYSIEHQNENAMGSTGASQAMVDKQSAPYDSALKSAQSEYNSLASSKNKIDSLSSVLSSYSNYNTPLSSSDISFLSSLGISF